MKILSIPSLLSVSFILSSGGAVQAPQKEVTFTIIYDNYAYENKCVADWGFSCLIEGKEKTILFDTGTKPEIFRKNLDNLNIDLNEVDMIVISHNHSDHTGGLDAVFEKRKDLPIYLPASVDINFKEQFGDFADQTIPVSQPTEICEGIYLTGEMGEMIKEQSLIVETKKGLVIVTGCSHQGVDNIVKKATKMSDEKIYLTFGGFHLLRHSEDQILNIIDVFLCEGVQKCGPTHCTGKEATMLFKETYGENFVEIGAGNRISI